jgi:hypothetical protein
VNHVVYALFGKGLTPNGGTTAQAGNCQADFEKLSDKIHTSDFYVIQIKSG